MQQDYSVFARLLPMLERADLFNSINFDVGIARTWQPGRTHPNFTAATTKLALLLCPSDAMAASGQHVNYRCCVGRGPHWGTDGRLWADDLEGPFQRVRPLSASDFSDGLANTAMLSEKLIGDGADFFTRQRDLLRVRPAAIARLTQGLPFGYACKYTEDLGTRPHFSFGGWSWLLNGIEYTEYNHALEPNSVIPDCGSYGTRLPVAAAAARSSHAGGVNVLMGDGSVRFISEEVEPALWLALSTRASGEQVHSR